MSSSYTIATDETMCHARKCDGVQHEYKLIYEAAAATPVLVIVVTVAKQSFKYTDGLYFSESMFHFYRQEK